MAHEAYPIRKVSFQTVDNCNRRCTYCVRSLRAGSGRYMPWERIINLLDRLHEIDYAGYIAPFLNNEPLLDERLPDIARSIRKKMPGARAYIYTNGDLLTDERTSELEAAGINKIFVSAHDTQTTAKVGKLRQRLENPDVIVITEYYELEKDALHNYGGLVRSGEVSQKRYPNQGCDLPFQQACVNYLGDVGLCCLDDLPQILLGNIDHQPIVEIFNNKKMQEVRTDLLEGKRQRLSVCKDCSFPGRASKIPF